MDSPTEESLRDILAEILERTGASRRELDRMASRRGLKLTHTTIGAILNGTHRGGYETRTLNAIADVGNVPRDRVYQAAGLPLPGRPFADELPDDVDFLDRASRDAVKRVISVMLEHTSPVRRRQRIDDWYAAQGVDASNVRQLHGDLARPMTGIEDPGPGDPHPALPSVTRWHDDLGIPATGGDEPGTHGDGHEFDV
ncbi:MAG: hypothetical protein Q8M17_10730 [Actinomycetota bacterium]|nr:hypothetical protein [Actinomycetota bacterium]